jgi:hypothetical protein
MFDAIRENLFPAAHAAIADWDTFPWHRLRGEIQAGKPHSSQALAIDVFGTVKVSAERDRILGALAERCGLPGEGPWTLDLEWIDPDNLLSEPRPTQIDAIAFGRRALLVFECKFTEPGGACSQPRGNGGPPQCNGDYAVQINPRNGIEARCALSGKGVRYWEGIPEIFGLDAGRDIRPCPFRGDAFQWMRNTVLARRLAGARGVSGAVVAAYADAEGLPMAEKVKSGTIGHVAASGARLVTPISYQAIVALARSVSGRPSEWDKLAAWIDRKIDHVVPQVAAG